MKRILFFTIVLGLISCFQARSFAEDEELVGSFTSVKGDVSILHTEEENWGKAEINMPVFPGDKVKTAASSEAELVLDDGSMLRMEEKTQIEIVDAKIEETDQEEGKKTFSVNLGIGKLLNNFKKLINKQSRYSVITSTAVAGVKGTEFTVECAEEQTEIVVFDGEVKVEDPKGVSVDLLPDQQTTVKKGKPPLKPQSIGTGARLYRENVVSNFQKRVEQNRAQLRIIQLRREMKIRQMRLKTGEYSKRFQEKLEKRNEKIQQKKMSQPKPQVQGAPQKKPVLNTAPKGNK